MIRPFSSERAAWVRPNRALLAAGGLLSVAAALVALGAVTIGFDGSTSVEQTMRIVFASPPAVLALVAWKLALDKKWPRLQRGLLAADAAGVRMDGRPIVVRRAVTQGLASRAADACVVRLVRRWPREAVDIVVPTESEGRELLVALGLDASQTAADMPGGSAVHLVPRVARTLVVGAIAASWFLIATKLGLLAATFWAFVGLAMTTSLLGKMPSRLRIGVDGLHFRWLAYRRFVPFNEVAAVRRVAEGKVQFLELVLNAGGVRRFPLAVGDPTEESLTFRRVVQAYDEHDERRTQVRDIEVLARAGRSARDWVASLRRIRAGGHDGLRTAHYPAERLWTVVEDPGAPAHARAAAATALASGAEADDRARLRGIASSVAEPRLRIALDGAASEDTSDEALADALAAVEADAAEHARR